MADPPPEKMMSARPLKPGNPRMTGGTAPKPGRGLLIEDDPGDVALISEAFKQSTTPIRPHVAGDGEQAMKFLRQRDDFTRASRPAARPGPAWPPRPGPARRAEDRRRPAHQPVAVVSCSRAEDDTRRSYALHANAYITKSPTSTATPR
jgi:hypothetical protein